MFMNMQQFVKNEIECRFIKGMHFYGNETNILRYWEYILW